VYYIFIVFLIIDAVKKLKSNIEGELTTMTATKVITKAIIITIVAMRRVGANILSHCLAGPIRKHVLEEDIKFMVCQLNKFSYNIN